MTTFAPPTHWHDASSYLADFFASVRIDNPPAGGAHSLEGVDVDGAVCCRWTVSDDGKVLAAWDPQHLLHGYFGGDRHDTEITYGLDVDDVFRSARRAAAIVVEVVHIDGAIACCREWGTQRHPRIPIGDLLDPSLWVPVDGGSPGS